MNREAIQKWIDALRSGDYKQCRGRLRRKDSFCATGVLCDVHSKEFNQPDNWHGYNYLGNCVCTPNVVSRWINQRAILINVTGMNDNDDMTFNKIADEIEKRFKFFKKLEDAKNE